MIKRFVAALDGSPDTSKIHIGSFIIAMLAFGGGMFAHDHGYDDASACSFIASFLSIGFFAFMGFRHSGVP